MQCVNMKQAYISCTFPTEMLNQSELTFVGLSRETMTIKVSYPICPYQRVIHSPKINSSPSSLRKNIWEMVIFPIEKFAIGMV